MNRRDLLATLGAASAAVAGCVGSDSGDDTPSETDTRPSETQTAIPRATASPTEETPPQQETDTPDQRTATPMSVCEGSTLEYLDPAAGFQVDTYADSEALGGGEFRPGPQPGPRMLATYRERLYATIPSQGRVVALPESDEEASPSRVVTVVEDLNRPHGIAFHEDTLYLALAGALVRYEMDGLTVGSSQEVLVDDIPRGVYHWTRSIAIHESRLYLSAGVCSSGECTGGDDDYLARITAFDLDGSNPTTYASGLRNAVGIEFHDGTLFATDNGIDDLGPDLPPDEINIVEEGQDYGFPDCYGENVPAEGADEGDCEGKTPPAVELQAHVAPLGFGFATTSAFPREFRGDMYVALHGSWTRDDPVGYKILQVPYSEGTLGTPRGFVTGWMPEGGTNEDARGRPVDVQVANGAMFVSDDLAGAIYRICYSGDN